jgi:hypothetical protein
MQPFGTNNFFRLMNSLDEENVNPLRGDGSIALKGASLETTIQALAPAIGRFGVDVAEFQRKAATSLIELPKTWQEFIRMEAKKVLSGDLDRLLNNIDKNFESKTIKSSEINSIVHFVLSYYEVIHRRSINKKEVIEGVLMRGLVKKSSFYAKISQADKSDGHLTWDSSHAQSDDIWRHFTLQTCRFIKQATLEMDDFLDDATALKSRLQDLIDREERDQFNRGSGRPSFGQWLPFVLFGLGVAGIFAIPQAQNNVEPTSVQVVSKSDISFGDGINSSHYAKPLDLAGANLHKPQEPISVDRPSITVKY